MQVEEHGTLLSDIASEQIHWLWEKRIPRGKLITLDGDPGLGKSLLTLDLAARITTGRPVPDGTPGVIYMLSGGTDASNTDPYAAKPTAENDWIKTGPHIMLVGSKPMLAGYPSGAKPDTSAPYVMWAGTPYAHLMVPVNKS